MALRDHINSDLLISEIADREFYELCVCITQCVTLHPDNRGSTRKEKNGYKDGDLSAFQLLPFLLSVADGDQLKKLVNKVANNRWRTFSQSTSKGRNVGAVHAETAWCAAAQVSGKSPVYLAAMLAVECDQTGIGIPYLRSRPKIVTRLKKILREEEKYSKGDKNTIISAELGLTQLNQFERDTKGLSEQICNEIYQDIRENRLEIQDIGDNSKLIQEKSDILSKDQSLKAELRTLIKDGNIKEYETQANKMIAEGHYHLARLSELLLKFEEANKAYEEALRYDALNHKYLSRYALFKAKHG